MEEKVEVKKVEKKLNAFEVCRIYRMKRYTEAAFKKEHGGSIKTMAEWQKILLKRGII